MTELIAGVEIPETAAVADATRLVQETTSPLIYHHSRRVYLFGMLHAHRLGLDPDPELLYLSAMFHDTGLFRPFSDAEQRFEVDGADHAQAFLFEHGFAATAADVVWSAIALHTTPGIPGRLGPEVAVTHFGVLTDAIGFALDELDHSQLDEVTAIHPRGDFKNEFMQTFLEGLKYRPDTTNGTVSADLLEHFIPGFQRTTMIDRIINAPWLN